MKKQSIFLVFIFLVFHAAPLPGTSAQAQQLSVQPADGKAVVLSRADIEALPRIKVTVEPEMPGISTAKAQQDQPAEAVTYEGPLLGTVLEKAGIALRDSLRGKRMSSCLLVEAADGYRVVIALPELDPAFNSKQFVFAILRNGKPLDEKERPYRIVIPEEKRMARWVRQVTSLKIVDVR